MSGLDFGARGAQYGEWLQTGVLITSGGQRELPAVPATS